MPKYALPYKYSSELVLLDELPSGASGYVYRAQYKRDGMVHDVVVKFFDHPPSHELFGYFTNEQVVLRALNQTYEHPYLVQYVAHNLSQSPFYLITQYVPGAHPLHKLKPSEITPSLLMRVVEQVADALDYLHEGKHTCKPVIHRDVKPDNILLDTTNNAVLIDLSIARHPHFSIVDEKIMGTPSYMPPEQYTGEEVAASDQFSLAAVVYELLTQQPLLAKNAQKAYQQLDELHKTDYARVRAALSGQYPEATTVLCKALAANPEDRYLTCTGFANALRDALKVDGMRVDAPISVTSRRRAATDWRRWLMPVAAILAVLLLGGATVGAVQVLGRGGGASTPPASTFEQMPTATLVATDSNKVGETTTATRASPIGAATATLVPIPEPTGIPPLARVTVPAVWGFNIAQARDILASRRLNYIVIPYVDTTQVNGFIGNQDPEPGLEVDAGTSITIYVVDNGGGNFESSGSIAPTANNVPVVTVVIPTAAQPATVEQPPAAAPKPPTPGPQLVAVPNVVGVAAGDAYSILGASGLQGAQFEQSVPGCAAFFVVSQEPPAGAPVPPGSTVTFGVCPQRTVPNVLGLPEADALAVLAQAGLQGVVIEYYADGTSPNGTVQDQIPGPNQLAPADGVVQLRVINRIEPPDTPDDGSRGN